MRKLNKELECIQLYSTVGLDIKGLIEKEKYHLTLLDDNDVDWLRKVKRRKSTSLSRVISVEYNVGKLYLFITLLHWLGCVNDLVDPNGWHFIRQVTLDKYFSTDDISKVTGILRKLGIINIDSDFIPGVKPKGYRLVPQYRYSKVVPLDGDYFLSKRISGNWTKNWKRLPQSDFEDWMCEMLEEVRILPEAMVAIDGLNFDDATDKDMAIKSARNGVRKLQSFELDDSVDRLTSFIRDENVRRIYTNVTGLKSELRNFLRHGEKKFAVLDLVASHPFWLLRLYREMGDNPKAKAESLRYHQLWMLGDGDFYQNVANQIGCSLSRRDVKAAFFEEFLYVENPSGNPDWDTGPMLDKFYRKNFPLLHREMEKRRRAPFLSLCDPHWRKASKLWKTSVELISPESVKEIPTRGRNVVYLALIKRELHVRVFDRAGRRIFDKNEMSLRKTKDQEVEVLKRGLISFWGAPKLPSPKIKELRVALGLITGLEKYNGQLAVENMRVESKAFIDGAAKEIFDGERFWIVSIHDALACDLENVEKVRGLLVKHITEGTGFEPVLKQEILEVDEPVSPSDGGLDVREVSMQLKGHQDCQERLQEAVSA